jgi:Icc-related predicted phosphoesterase
MTKRIYFAADVHGSEEIWRKWITAMDYYKPNILILAGDLTGKAVCPIVASSNGVHECNVFGRKWVLKTDKELQDMIRKLEFVGHYPFVCTLDQFNEISANWAKVGKKLIQEQMAIRMKRWLDLLAEKINSKLDKCIVMPGNDDEFVIDPVIKSYEDRGITYPLGNVIDLGYNYEMISLDYVNSTP